MCSVSHANFWNDFCLPHATFSIVFVMHGCCLEKPTTKYDVNRNSSESFLPDKPVDQVHCPTLKLAKTLSGASIVVIAGEHKAQTNKQTDRQTERRTNRPKDEQTNIFGPLFQVLLQLLPLFNWSDLCCLATIWGTAAARCCCCWCCCMPSAAAAATAAKLLLGVRLWQKLLTTRGEEERSLLERSLLIMWGQNWI